MSIVIGLGVGLAFGFAAIPVNRLWATALVVTPVLGWFALLVVSIDEGLTDDHSTRLALGLLGILLGLAVGQVFDKRDHARARRHRK